MITVREGLPGSGKTLSAVGEDVLSAIREKRKVVTNIPLDADKISKLLGFDAEPFIDVRQEDEKGARFFSKREHFDDANSWRSEGDKGKGPVIVIDEAHEVLTVPGFTSKADDAIVEWFAVHRHKGGDCTLITQSFGDLPSKIRSRVERRFWYRKAGMFGLGNRYFQKTFVGAAKVPVSSGFGKYKAEWFGLYKSVDAHVIESLPKQKNVLFSPKLIVLLLLLAAIIAYVVFNGVHFLGTRGLGSKSDNKAPAQASSSVDVSAETEAQGDGPKLVKPVAGGMLGAGRVEPSQELLNLQDRIAVVHAQQELQQAIIKRPPDDELDGASALITGYLQMNGQATYFVDLFRKDQPRENVKAVDLIQYGFEVTAVDRCTAYLRGDRGTYRLTCDVPARFGKPVDDFVPGRLPPPVLNRSGAVEEKLPIQ